MLIECTIRRPKGSLVEFDGPLGPRTIHYFFAPTVEQGPHIAEVDNPDHVAQLLAIPTSFRVVMATKPGMTLPTAAAPAPAAPDDGTAALKARIAELEAAMAASVVEAIQPADLDAEVPAEAPAVAVTPVLDEMTLEQAQAAFEAKFGRKPNAKAKLPKLLSYLNGEITPAGANDE